MTRSARLLILGFASVLGMLPGQATAQAFPSQPVRIVVPFSAGGLVDVLARGMASELVKVWGKPVLVDNRPGANTIIAAQAVAQAPADGHTLLFAVDATVSSNQYLFKKLPYDPVKSFVPVVHVAKTRSILLVGSMNKARTVEELMAAAKARPGKLTYGSFGVGSASHLYTLEFERITGGQFSHVPYKGVSDVMNALMSGEIDLAFTGLPPAIGLVKTGRLRALAMIAPQRSELLADVPTIAEAGIPGFEAGGWFGLLAPAGTPQGVVNKLAADIGRVIEGRAFGDQYIRGVGMELVNQGPVAFAAFLDRDRASYARYLKDANFKLD